MSRRWIDEIKSHAERESLEVISLKADPLPLALVPMSSKTFLSGAFEFVLAVQGVPGLSAPSQSDMEHVIHSAYNATKAGEKLYWDPVSLLARKTNSV